MTSPPLQPPVPFSDFEFTFDPSLSSLFPNPPPLPSSADLFSPAETTDLLGFLDNFGDLNWDLPPNHPQYNEYPPQSSSFTPYSNPHLNTVPEPSSSTRPKINTRSVSSRAQIYSSVHPNGPNFNQRESSQLRTTPSD